MKRTDIAGVILAGGLSRRMGAQDKPLSRLGDSTILHRVVSRFSPQVECLAINANGDPARFAGFGLPLIADTLDGFAGPLAGVLAGLEWATSHGDSHGIVTVAGDTPFFPADLVTRLARAANGRIAVAASNGRQHSVFALWPLTLKHDLKAFLAEPANRKVSEFIRRHDFVEVEFPLMQVDAARLDPFFNINTPDDLARANTFLRSIEE